MHQFFIKNITKEATELTLSEEESKHACRVLRLKKGDVLSILNGKGYQFTATIVDDHPKHCLVKIVYVVFEEAPKNKIHIAIAPTKNMDRLEWFLEKATEIGVDSITPIIGDNSERKQLKTERLEKVIIAAQKQSKRFYLPVLNPLTTVTQFIDNHPNSYFAHCENEVNKRDFSLEKFKEDVTIMVGPEGDFSQKEIAYALKKGLIPVSLGANRLRTETAGVYAVVVAKSNMK
jgi:16S rRNA (uracil1498-N3)-methyltransferase